MHNITITSADDLKLLRALKPAYTESQLGARLVESGAITPEQLRKVIQYKHKFSTSLLDATAKLGFLDESNRAMILASRLSIPYVHVRAMDIARNTIRMIPAELIRKYRAFPLGLVDGKLIIAMSDPCDVEAVQTINFATKRVVEVVMTSEQDIEVLIERYLLSSAEDDILSELDASLTPDLRSDRASEQALRESAEQKPVVKFVDTLLRRAVALGASDINVRPNEHGADIYYRIDGNMRYQRTLNLSQYTPIASRIKIMSGMNIAERRLPQDGSMFYEEQEHRIDFRVSVIPTITGESVVVRVLDATKGLLTLDNLGLPVEEIARMRDVLTHSYGIFLVTGPTGSGKSTTLYAVINERKQKNPHIITVEDPVEYRLEGVEQIQIKTSIGYTFAEALRHILRHDPDEILIGEMRDFETAEIAVKASLTGHFVMSTLHTNDAASSITRLIDMGIEPYLISSTVIGVLAQRLVRRICPKCCKPDPDDAHLKKFFNLPADFPAFVGTGCSNCHNTGYRGRLMVGELLSITPALKALIQEKTDASVLKAQAVRDGMSTLTENALQLVRDKKTTLEEAFRVRHD
jgi:type IV pilus assembly protein PilB